MPSKKKKYNARFPAGRIKRIMQSDEEVGKVAQAVPIIISRTLELFVESLLTKTLKITNSRNAKTLSTSHMKQCIMSEQRFDFLRELVRNIPDISVAEEAANYNEEDNQSSPEEQYPDSDTPYDLSMPSTSVRAVRQQQLQMASNGHNSNNNNTGVAQYDFQRNHLKRSISSNSGSVIRHTTAAAVSQVYATDCSPAKLARSDSSPVPQYHHMSTKPATIQQQQQQQHSRLKHQSYSMPTATIPNTNCPPTQQLRLTPQPTAIPAPIVNIDYYNKPIVKIDYSNIPITEISDTAPASAPANIASMSNNNSTFNFSTEPVINIDLSNIVNTATGMATISIGTPPPPLPSATSLPASAPLKTTNMSNETKVTANAVSKQQSRNSKVAMAETSTFSSSPSSSSSSSTSLTVKANALAAAAAAAATMTTAKTNKSDSYLDMDEDYDNI